MVEHTAGGRVVARSNRVAPTERETRYKRDDKSRIYKSSNMQMNIYQSVYGLVKKIPVGRVATYGLIAEKLRSVNRNINAHVVGWILHKNNTSEVPCHRVVDRNGRLAPNFAFNGAKEQKLRLKDEGVKFLDDMHVDLNNNLWTE